MKTGSWAYFTDGPSGGEMLIMHPGTVPNETKGSLFTQVMCAGMSTMQAPDPPLASCPDNYYCYYFVYKYMFFSNNGNFLFKHEYSGK